MSRGTVNKVILIGNLGQDPEVRYSPNGEAWANISVATTESWKDKNTGQPVDRTEWNRVVLYRRLAEIAGEYLKKGAKVYIEGRLQTRQWEKDGVKHYTTEIIGNELTMLDRASESAGASRSGGGYAPSASPAPAARNSNQDRYGAAEPAPARQQYPDPAFSRGSDDGFDDDIPF